MNTDHHGIYGSGGFAWDDLGAPAPDPAFGGATTPPDMLSPPPASTRPIPQPPIDLRYPGTLISGSVQSQPRPAFPSQRGFNDIAFPRSAELPPLPRVHDPITDLRSQMVKDMERLRAASWGTSTPRSYADRSEQDARILAATGAGYAPNQSSQSPPIAGSSMGYRNTSAVRAAAPFPNPPTPIQPMTPPRPYNGPAKGVQSFGRPQPPPPPQRMTTGGVRRDPPVSHGFDGRGQKPPARRDNPQRSTQSKPAMPLERQEELAALDLELDARAVEPGKTSNNSVNSPPPAREPLTQAQIAQRAAQRLADAQKRIAHAPPQLPCSNGSSNGDLDGRAVELRRKVTQAQQALDERARKLKDKLDTERERLRAYHAKLRSKAGEIAAAARNRSHQQEVELGAQRAALEADRAEYERRTRELDARIAAFEGGVHDELSRRKVEFDQAAGARLNQIEHGAATIQSDFNARYAALADREAKLRQEMKQRLEETQRDVVRREAEVDRNIQSLGRKEAEIEAREKLLLSQESEIDRAVRARLEEIKRESSDRQAQFESKARMFAERESELEKTLGARLSEIKREDVERRARLEAQQKSLLDREAALAAQERALAEHQQKLEHSINVRLGQIETEAQRLKLEFESKEQQLLRREAELADAQAAQQQSIHHEIEQWQGKLDAQRRVLAERESEIPQVIGARLNEIKQAAAEKEAELSRRLEDLERRERQLRDGVTREAEDFNAKEAALEAEFEAKKRALFAREEELERAWRDKRSALEREFEQKLADSREHFGDPEKVRQLVDQRVAQRETQIETMRAELARQESELAKARFEFAERDALLRGRADELDRLGEEIRKRKLESESAAATFAEQKAALEEEQRKLRALAANIEDQSRSVPTRIKELAQQEQSLATKSIEMDRREAELTARTQIVDQNLRTVEQESARLATDRAKIAALDEAERSLAHAKADATQRAAQVAQAEQALRGRSTELERRERRHTEALQELEGARQDLERQRIELHDSEAAVNERIRRGVEHENRLKSSIEEMEQERRELARQKAAHADNVAAFRSHVDEVARQEASLQEERLAVQLERKSLREQQDAVAAKRHALADESRAVAELREAVAREQAALLQSRTDLSRDEQDLTDRRGAVEAEAAKVESQRILLKDRERTLEEDRSRLTEARRQFEELSAALAKRRDETETFRRELLAKAERIKDRKTQLAADALTVDTRLRAVTEELEKARQQRLAADELRERLADERREFDVQREQFEKRHEEFEQSRTQVEADLATIDDDRRDISEREGRLTMQASQLEAFRRRLDEEFEELKRQRRDLVEVQEQSGDSAAKITALTRQVESRDQSLRDREAALSAREESLSQRLSDLVVSEEKLRRQISSIESKSREIQDESAALALRRSEFEALMDSRRSAVEQQRRQSESELASQRAALAERERALESTLSFQRDNWESQRQVDDQVAFSRLREQVERESTERIQAASQREERAEQVAAQRISEVESDIARRLTQLEEELKARRNTTDDELARRRQQFEDELLAEKARVQEEIDHLRRSQQAAQQERDALAQRRAELEDRGHDPVPDRHESSHHSRRPIVDDDSDRAWQNDDFAVALSQPSIEPDPWLSDAAFGRNESSTRREKSRPEPFVDETSIPEFDADHADLQSTWTKKGGFRPTRAIVAGALLGLLAATVYMAGFGSFRQVHGRLALSRDGVAPMTAADHLAAILQPVIFEKASQRAGVDLLAPIRRNAIQIAAGPSGDAIELTAEARDVDPVTMKSWLAAIGGAYEESLRSAVSDPEEVSRRVARLESDLQSHEREIARNKADLEKSESRLKDARSADDVDAARAKQDDLRAQVASAQAAVTTAKTALDQARSEAKSTDAVIPTAAQIKEVASKDAQLKTLQDQLSAKTGQLHEDLSAALQKSQAPLATLLSTIDALIAETQRQLKHQTDLQIRQELIAVQSDLSAYHDQADKFAAAWDALAPKIAAWSKADDSSVLLDYQKSAESLVREFHAQSRESFGSAAQRSDAIGRGGSEMTKRRIIQSSLTRLAHLSLDARNQWIVSAREVTPRYNLQIKTLRDAIVEMEPRVQQRIDLHKRHLAKRLADTAGQDRIARIEQLQNEFDQSTHRHQELSDELAKVESVANADRQTAENASALRNDIAGMQSRLAALEQRAADTKLELQRVQASRTVNRSGAARYETVEASSAGLLDFGHWRGAAAIAIGVILITLIIRWKTSLTAMPRPAMALADLT